LAGPPEAPARRLSGASAWTVQGHEVRAYVDVDVVHVVIGHDAARVVVSDQPSDDLAFSTPYAEIDGLAGSMLRRCPGACDASARTAGRDEFDISEVASNPAEQVAGGGRQARCGDTGGISGIPVAGVPVTGFRVTRVSVAVVGVRPGLDGGRYKCGRKQ